MGPALAALCIAAILIANCICIRPGVGGARGDFEGTEFGRYFGWPVTVVAELWRSDDLELAGRILEVPPFYRPQADMQLAARRISVIAGLLNAVFALGIAVFVSAVFPPFSVPRAEAAVVGSVACVLIYRFGNYFGSHL